MKTMTQQELINYLPTTTKGVLVIGKPSVGKTYSMKNFIKEFNNKVKESGTTFGQIKEVDLYEMNRLTRLNIDIFKSHKDYTENELPACITDAYNERYNFSMYIDDIGNESHQINNFGNKSSVFADIITKFYKTKLSTQNLFATTNFSIKDLKEIYGERVTERLLEMCEVIILDDINRRHQL
jgi:DNA replication protein DnaC